MSDRKQHWESVYRSKSPRDVSWFQARPDLSLRLIADAGIGADTAVIDVGGGASRLVDGLCEAGFTDISVLDVSASAIQHSQQRLAEKACDIHWLEQDITTFEPRRQYGLWHDRAVFHFLTERDDRKKYVRVLRQALAPGGHLVIMAFAIGGPLKCSGLDIVQYDTTKLLEALGPGFDLRDSGFETHVTPAGGQQKFAFFRLTRTTEAP